VDTFMIKQQTHILDKVIQDGLIISSKKVNAV